MTVIGSLIWIQGAPLFVCFVFFADDVASHRCFWPLAVRVCPLLYIKKKLNKDIEYKIKKKNLRKSGSKSVMCLFAE